MKPISKNQKLKTKKYFAFTIVELIIVVAILAVVATISFVSYNSYNTTSRDSARIIDITSITSGLNQYVYKGGTYPMPEGIISSGTINGLSVAYKGEIRDGITRLAGLSKALKDPLTNGYYVYGVSFNKKYFQIGVTLEDSNSVAIQNNYDNPFVSGIYADNSTASYSTKVSGNYLGLIKFNTGSSVYLANIPSLIFNFSGSNVYSGNLLISSGVYFVIDKNNNYPYALNGSMNINNKDGNTILQSITNNSGATLTGVDITSITNSTGTVSSLFSGSVLSSFGYSLDVITSAVGVSNINSNIVVTNTNCSSTTYSGYTISALNNGSSQTFTKTISNGTGSILATCNSTVLSYGAESIVCSSGYVQSGSSCIPVYANCNATKTALPASTDGVYWIKPDSNPAFQVYCDMTNDGGGWTFVVGIDASNRNHFITGSYNTSNLIASTGTGKFSDNVINAIKTSAIKFTCGSQTRYFQSSCTFAATSLASGGCSNWATTYNGTPTQQIQLDGMYGLQAWYDTNSIIYATITSGSYGYTLNGCAQYITPSSGKVWVK